MTDDRLSADDIEEMRQQFPKQLDWTDAERAKALALCDMADELEALRAAPVQEPEGWRALLADCHDHLLTKGDAMYWAQLHALLNRITAALALPPSGQPGKGE